MNERPEEERLDREAEEALARPKLTEEARQALRHAPRWRAEERTVVVHLVTGDTFRWADRWLTLVKSEQSTFPGNRRQGRYLTASETDGKVHRLQYWDDETVVTGVRP